MNDEDLNTPLSKEEIINNINYIEELEKYIEIMQLRVKELEDTNNIDWRDYCYKEVLKVANNEALRISGGYWRVEVKLVH